MKGRGETDAKFIASILSNISKIATGLPPPAPVTIAAGPAGVTFATSTGKVLHLTWAQLAEVVETAGKAEPAIAKAIRAAT